MLFPTSIANSLIAVGTDGLQERDRMVRAAIAIVCELGKVPAGAVAMHGALWVNRKTCGELLLFDIIINIIIIAIACVALKNPEVVAKRGGLSTILKSVIDCQLSRINEALITTILHLLNHPRTRQYVRVDVELEVCAHTHTHTH